MGDGGDKRGEGGEEFLGSYLLSGPGRAVPQPAHAQSRLKGWGLLLAAQQRTSVRKPGVGAAAVAAHHHQ